MMAAGGHGMDYEEVTKDDPDHLTDDTTDRAQLLAKETDVDSGHTEIQEKEGTKEPGSFVEKARNIVGGVKELLGFQGSGDSHTKQKKKGTAKDHVIERSADKEGVATLQHGEGGSIIITDSDIRITAGQQVITYNPKDLQCSDIHLKQPFTINEFVCGAVVTWELSQNIAGKQLDHKSTDLKIRDSVGKEVSNKHFPSTTTRYDVLRETLRCGKKYTVTVIINLRHENGAKIPVTSKESFIMRPSKPSNIRVQYVKPAFYGSNSIAVAWSMCDGAKKYQVDIYDMNKRRLVNGITKEAEHQCKIDLNDFPLKVGNEYIFVVTAINGEWETKSEEEICFVGGAKSPKHITRTLHSETNAVTVSWKPPNDKPKEYEVQATCESEKPIIMETTNTTVTFEGLKAGVQYTFRVRAMYDNDQSDWTTSESLNTKACQIKVENFRIERNPENPSSMMNCFWDRNDDAKEYKIKVRSEKDSRTVLISGQSDKFTLTDLLPNKNYKVSAKAKEERGYGPPTQQKDCKTEMGTATDVAINQLNNEIKVSFTKAPLSQKHIVELIDENGRNCGETEVHDDKAKFLISKYNLEYYATIKAMYSWKEIGSAVRTKKMLSVPDQPNSAKFEIVLDEDYPSSMFELSWDGQEKCHEHEVEIKYENYDEKCIIRVEDSQTCLRYHCLHKGCALKIRIRAKNVSGYGEWSIEKLFKTAPDQVQKSVCDLDKGKIVACWQKVDLAEYYEISLFEEGCDRTLEFKRTTNCFYEIDYAPDHGTVYFCVIRAGNSSGNGLTVTSPKLLTPLDPPTGLTWKENLEGVTFSWTPSKGMKAAKVSFTNSKLERIEQHLTVNRWISPPICPGEAYTFRVWARNGKILSRDHKSAFFLGAPAGVIVSRNKNNPEKSIDVEVVSNYSGPFMLYIDKDERKQFKAETRCTIENLKPATEYKIRAACKYPDCDKLSGCSVARSITTLPAQVIGVKCSGVSGTSRKVLSWDSCGNRSIKYNVSWSKDNELNLSDSTFDTTYEITDLKPGSYEFTVSAGEGKKSDVCRVVVPETPSLTLEVHSPTTIFASCSHVDKAQSYVFKVFSGDASDFAVFRSVVPQIWIDFLEYDFKPGNLYTLGVQAKWDEHLSSPALKTFLTGLPAPKKVQYLLDKDDPRHKIRCAWKPSRGMKRAKIELKNSKNVLKESREMLGSTWTYDGLCSNEQYTLTIYPGDGEQFYSDEYAEKTFVTAPDPPDKVFCRANKECPETCLDVEIVSNYAGPFIITYRANGQEKSLETSSKCTTITDLQPGQLYYIHAQCKFQQYMSAKTEATYPNESK